MSRGAAPGRADLVRAWVLRGPEAMAETAELLGFRHHPRRRSKVEGTAEAKVEIRDDGFRADGAPSSGHAAPRQDDPPMPMCFWRPVARSYRRQDESSNDASDPEVLEPKGGEDFLAEREGAAAIEAPIVGWPRLWRALDDALRVKTTSGAVDIESFVERTARGEVLYEVPRRRSRELGSTVLVVDRSPRLALFWRDKAGLRAALEEKLGPASVRVMSVEMPGQIPGGLRPDQQCLVVGDLGLYGDDRTRRAWAAWAATVRRRLGRRPLALIPCPRRGWRDVALRDWRALDWSTPNRLAGRTRGAAGEGRDPREQALETVLCMASVAMRLETGLLRDLCRLVPEAGLDTEVSLRRHPAVSSAGHLGISLKPSAVRPLRRRFMDLPEALQRSAVEVLQRWHEAERPEIWTAELMALLGEGLPPELVDEGSVSRSVKLLTGINRLVARPSSKGDALELDTDSFLWRMGQWGSEGLWTHPECRESFERGFRALKARYPESDYPVGVTPDMMVDREADRPIRKVWIVQVGAVLQARDPGETGSPWCELSFREPEIVVTFGDSRPRVWNPDEGELELPESPEGCTLVTDVERVEFEAWTEPAWAVASGRDRFGLWATFEIKGIEQRMRWIPPGRFIMGSPESEEGRDEDEGPQHEVVLSEGFWLAETACVQELWRAVMGDEPSGFKGDRRPVEQVSWRDCQTFFDRLNFAVRGFDFQLPTEAEWEFACRAGTDSPTWLDGDGGDLDSIAWHSSNSGDETQDVAEKAPNPHGLHDMLGNVFEWCWDRNQDYSSGLSVDPEGPEQGTYRVIRGGSWGDQARFVRAASRGWYDPGSRLAVLGFRLSRGQGGGAGEREGKGSGAPRGTRGTAPRSRRARTWVDRLGWASDGGTDRFGRWASFELAGVEHRLRWIYPGTFLMGSPESEEGRWDDEGPQHEVTLSEGYWLGETPCTQDLWQAVMGENPSRFRSPRRPVEQVSWQDCQEFFGRLQDRNAGLEFRLPTEAQWEYACRAGTTSATWKGDLEFLGERHAKILDSIAWYGGNSGVGFDLESGYDSSEWPEKQYAHRVAGTRLVATKAPNPWGLYDMLGNVYEWCFDWKGSYTDSPMVDPTGREEGRARVFRGGSWDDRARDLRAACRDWRGPGNRRSGYLGFRLSRGPSGGAIERSDPGAGAVSRSADEGRAGGETGGAVLACFQESVWR